MVHFKKQPIREQAEGFRHEAVQARTSATLLRGCAEESNSRTICDTPKEPIRGMTVDEPTALIAERDGEKCRPRAAFLDPWMITLASVVAVGRVQR